MSFFYTREIPRDLFNEANLLKCYAQLYLEIERLGIPDVELVHPGNEPFMAAQDQSSGALRLANVHLMVRGAELRLVRGLNSRDSWPLYAETADGDEIEVFDGGGRMTPDMQNLLRGGNEAA